MPISRLVERKAWLGLFNPCGLMVVNDFGFKSCICPKDSGLICVPRDSYRMAGFVLAGSTLNPEKVEYGNFLRQNRGRDVRLENGIITKIGDNQGDLLKSVGVRASTILDEVDMCTRLGQPIPDDYRTRLTPEQVKILDKLYHQNETAGLNSRFSLDGAIAAVDGMKSLLTQALDLDLGGYGLIARCAISFGLGDRVPQAAYGLIYKGQSTNQLVRMN
jgi:hypothetical protein